jgi:cell shape-determining protein MreC
VGKIGQVGRWTSTVIPLTDPAFRGRAQLVRSSPRGLVLGAEGVVAGDEQGHCRLQLIPATEPVGVGDDVYTSIRESGLPIPMYYGRVVEAHLPEGATHWEIRVQPAETLHEARAVQVLRSILNTARTTLELDAPEELR